AAAASWLPGARVKSVKRTLDVNGHCPTELFGRFLGEQRGNRLQCPLGQGGVAPRGRAVLVPAHWTSRAEPPNAIATASRGAPSVSTLIERSRSGDKLDGRQSVAGVAPPAALTTTDSRNSTRPRWPRRGSLAIARKCVNANHLAEQATQEMAAMTVENHSETEGHGHRNKSARSQH